MLAPSQSLFGNANLEMGASAHLVVIQIRFFLRSLWFPGDFGGGELLFIVVFLLKFGFGLHAGNKSSNLCSCVHVRLADPIEYSRKVEVL